MKVTILGCGSAYGVPYVGNGWGDCDPQNPRNRRSTSSILIEQEGTKLLVDMGPEYREQSSRHGITDVDGVFFTHPHADHIAGIYNLPMMMTHYQDRDLPLLADSFTRANIERSYWFMFDPSVKIEYFGLGRPFWHDIKAYEPAQLGNMTLLPFPQVHGRMMSMGLRIGDFAYSTDVSEFPKKSFEALRGVETWIVECNNEYDRGSKSHAYLEKIYAWARELQPKRVILTHLEYTMDYDTISSKLPEGFELAYDGMELDIPDPSPTNIPLSAVTVPQIKPSW
jgi:phosphoribosyl 1,2-cyclic phosphate phosphodiesterase